MSAGHARDAARPLQAQNPQSPEIHMVASNSHDAGEFPMVGRFSATKWATFLHCDRKTVERYVRKYKVPHKKPGNQIFVDAAVFWEYVPDGAFSAKE